MKSDISRIITGLAEYYDKNLSPSQIKMYVEDLSHLSPDTLAIAVRAYRMNPDNVFFPLPAKLAEAAAKADGRPGTEEAWSMLPKDEYTSIVWSDEMRIAFGVAAPLMHEDRIAARMAFKEKYESLVKQARSNAVGVKWSVSYGIDKQGREAAIKEAMDKNRISISTAQKMLPEVFEPTPILIGSEKEAAEIKKLIGLTFKGVESV